MSTIRAWWRKADEIVLVFPRDIPQVLPHIYVSGAGTGFRVLRPQPAEFAKLSSYYIDGGSVRFRLDPAACDSGALPDCDYYVCGSFNGWANAVKNPVWRMKPDSYGVLWLPVPLAALDSSQGAVLFKFASGDGRWIEPNSEAPNAVSDRNGNHNLKISADTTGRNILVLKFDGACDPTVEIRVKIPQMKVDMPVAAAELLRSIYSSSRLGAYRHGCGTKFSIFAPRAKAAYLRYWAKNSPTSRVLYATSHDGAVWTATSDEDLQGYRYAWHIDGDKSLPSSNFDVRFSVADPYANAFETSSGAAIVKYYDEIPDAPTDFAPPPWHELSIMEVHVRDVLANACADLSDGERLTFAGLTKWLKSPDCYLRRAGVNCVELQPVQEFTAENRADYEWGYMPVGWFAPASSYATDPQNATQNDDLRNLVNAFHEAGIAVLFDVVYNHYGEPNYLGYIDSGYYFETASDGSLMNFSGCGNDVRAKSPMALRLIIESLAALLVKYGADGFRFDLAELLGMGALREIETCVKRIKPSAILIAEPWSFRGHIGASLKSTGYASWNDGFREFMLSYAKGEGNCDGFKYFMAGSRGGYASFPTQTVNYLESHDDMCLFDRITSAHGNPSRWDLRRYKLAYALVFLAVGIPMAAEGFDLIRTKGGLNNTYKNGAANALDYIRGTYFSGECAWLRSLAIFRLSESARALRLSENKSEGYFEFFTSDGTSAAGVLFNASGESDAKRIFAALNPTGGEVELPAPDCVKTMKQIADIDRFNEAGLTDFVVGVQATVKLPPVSLAIWCER